MPYDDFTCVHQAYSTLAEEIALFAGTPLAFGNVSVASGPPDPMRGDVGLAARSRGDTSLKLPLSGG